MEKIMQFCTELLSHTPSGRARNIEIPRHEGMVKGNEEYNHALVVLYNCFNNVFIKVIEHLIGIRLLYKTF